MGTTRACGPLALVTVLLLCALAVQAQSDAKPIIIGHTTHTHSDILNEDRELRISKPASYDEGKDRYPVLYVLDAENSFEYAASVVRFLAENERIPEMIVVGIANPDFASRTRDLTPPSQSETDNRFSPGGGGADSFLSFMAHELIPYIDRTWRTRPCRILVGHSFGGLFVIHALVTEPKLFNAYIAIDPTVSWNNEAEIARARRFLSDTRELPADLFVSSANAFGSPSPGVRAFVAELDRKTPAGLRWHFEWMNRETHTSVPLRSTYAALDTIFDGWHLTDPVELYDKGGLEAIHRHFREGGKRWGYERTTPPFTISLLVAGLATMGRLDEASAVLLADPKNYPAPWNQLDALARAYAERGQKQEAIRFYGLSLQANPDNDFARQKLVEMGAPPATPKSHGAQPHQ